VAKRISGKLLDQLKRTLELSQSRVYALIDAKVRETSLPRYLAAIALAADNDINISRHASDEDLAAMRQTARATAPAPVVLPSENQATPKRAGTRAKKQPTRPPRRGNTVWVVHGRNTTAREELFALLRALRLNPLEWTQALRNTKKGTPYTGEVLDAAFSQAVAVVVLLSPDDDARLKSKFRKRDDPPYEKKLTGQARANVLFEAGMAFGKNPNSTVLVQIGNLRPFSDVGGRHVVRLSDSATSRNELATKLANAGCNVDTSGADWLTIGKFKT
jgi:predicted nucleotide-binding protein